MTTILAFDASTRWVGYAIGTTTNGYSAGGQIDVRQMGKIDTRIRAILLWATALIQRIKPDVVAIEQPVVGKNSRTALQLGRLVGNLEAAAVLDGAEVLWIYPSQVKAALIHGKAAKEEMIRVAQWTIGQPVEGEHHADAVGCLIAAQVKLKLEEVK